MNGKRLTAIVAGAGFGKTTLMAQAASSWEMKTIWYRLDESDSDLVTFIAYHLAGIRKYYPDFGTATRTSTPGVGWIACPLVITSLENTPPASTRSMR